MNGNVTLTDAAATKAAFLKSATGLDDDWALRLAVQPGGCSGLRYQLFFDNRAIDGDNRWTIETADGDLAVVIDPLSAPYLTGATIEYHDTIDKQGFVIDNPNAAGTCSCGDSFH